MPRTRSVLACQFFVRAVLSLAGCLALSTVGEAAQTQDAAARWQHATAAVFEVSVRRIDPNLPDIPFRTWLKNVVGGDANVFPGGYQNPCEDAGPNAMPQSTSDTPWDLCTFLNATMTDKRIVAIGLAASVIPDVDRAGEWRVT